MYTGGGLQYNRIVFADIVPDFKQFTRHIYGRPEVFAALRWIDGKLYGLAVNGDPECEKEYLYVHLHKRPMTFSAGLENDHSFMIIPNEFVKDHAPTQEEIAGYLTPDSGYEKAYRASYKYFSEKPLAEQIRLLIVRDNAYKILKLKMLWNKLLGRRLYRRYEER